MKHNPHLAQAREMHERANWPAAIQLYERALSIEPSNADIYLELSACLDAAGRFDEAERRLDEAERLDKSRTKSIARLREKYRIRKTFHHFYEATLVDDIQPLLELIRRKEEALVQEALGQDKGGFAKLLWKVGLKETAIRQVIAGLKDQNFEVRFVTAAKLGIMRYAPAVEDLITALGDEHEWVRSAASTALGDIGDKKAISALEKVASSDTNQTVRESASEALDKLRAA